MQIAAACRGVATKGATHRAHGGGRFCSKVQLRLCERGSLLGLRNYEE